MSECLAGLLWRMDAVDFLRWLSCGSSRMTVGWTIRVLQDGYQKEPISDPGRNLSIRVSKSSMCRFPEGTAMGSYLFKCSMIFVMTWCSRFRISRWLLRDSCVRVFQDGRQETLLSGCSKMASSDLFTRVFSKMDATKIKQTLCLSTETTNACTRYRISSRWTSALCTVSCKCSEAAFEALETLLFEQGRFPELEDGESELLVRLNLPSSSFPSLFSFFLGNVEKKYWLFKVLWTFV